MKKRKLNHVTDKEDIIRKRHYLYIPQAASNEIDKYGAKSKLTPALISDLKIFTGIVYQFTEMRKRGRSPINHEFFKAVLGEKIHNKQKGYRVIKKHALKSVIQMEDYIKEKRSCIYWIRPELIDDEQNVTVYTENQIPIKQSKEKDGYYAERKKQIDRFLDEIYLPRMQDIELKKRFNKVGKELIKKHKLDSTLSDKKRFTERKLDNNIHQMEHAFAGLNHSTIDKDGRIYNIMTYVKRELRLIEGIKLSERDISSSQPFIMAAVLNYIINSKRIHSKELFINKIIKLADRKESESAKNVMEIIQCIEAIKNGDEIRINQKYYKKNDLVFEKMTEYEGIKLVKEIRDNTTNENKVEVKYVKKIRGKITAYTENIIQSKEELNELGINIYEEKNGHIPINEFEEFWFRNRNVFKKDEKGYTKLSRDTLLNKFSFIDKYKYCNGELENNYEINLKKDTSKFNYHCYTICGNQVLGEEVETLLKLTSTGRFYDYLLEKFSTDITPFVQNLSVIRDDLSVAEYERLKENPELIDSGYKIRIVKMMVMRWMNDDYAYYAGDDSIENWVFSAMMTVFPYITSIIFILRINFGSKAFHSLLTVVESEFVYSVVERCNTRTNKHQPFLVGTVHDSFVVEPSKVKFLEEHIKTISEKMFGTACFVKGKEY